MTTDVKTKAAEALYPILDAFHLIGDKSLRSVRQIYTEGCLDRIVLDFDSVSLLVTADENDDSIDFKIANVADVGNVSGIDASCLEPWVAFIGKRFGWGWITMNQQGYCDGLLLSFGEIIFPQLVLNVMASSIEVGKITKDSWVSVQR